MDVNGNPLTDFVYVEYLGASAGTRIRTLLSNGDGTFSPRQGSGSEPKRVDAKRWRPMDANADGLSDLVHIGYFHSGTVTCLEIELLISTARSSVAPEPSVAA